jgi:hypothetical protein
MAQHSISIYPSVSLNTSVSTYMYRKYIFSFILLRVLLFFVFRREFRVPTVTGKFPHESSIDSVCSLCTFFGFLFDQIFSFLSLLLYVIALCVHRVPPLLLLLLFLDFFLIY